MLLCALLIPLWLFGLATLCRGRAQLRRLTTIPLHVSLRIAAADVSYLFGVNEHEELQTLYWGSRFRPRTTRFPQRAR